MTSNKNQLTPKGYMFVINKFIKYVEAAKKDITDLKKTKNFDKEELIGLNRVHSRLIQDIRNSIKLAYNSSKTIESRLELMQMFYDTNMLKYCTTDSIIVLLRGYDFPDEPYKEFNNLSSDQLKLYGLILSQVDMKKFYNGELYGDYLGILILKLINSYPRVLDMYPELNKTKEIIETEMNKE